LFQGATYSGIHLKVLQKTTKHHKGQDSSSWAEGLSNASQMCLDWRCDEAGDIGTLHCTCNPSDPPCEGEYTEARCSRSLL